MASERRNEEAEIELDPSDVAERRTLIWVLLINCLQVVVAGTVGVVADSTGLLGAALDNLADAGVYAVSLYAVGRSVAAKSRVAALSGALLIILGVGLLAEVLRRFFVGAEPIGLAMIVAAVANAATNLICLRLLRSHRDQGVHMQASWIFTTNDMLANAGIAVSGAAVMFFASPLPDLIIGLVVGGLVLKGGWEILQEARDARRASVLTQKD
ncbi:MULTISPECIES: cation transporter [Bosea]|uniref:Cation transporter n=2 Tax=Bosea TaxID=85413 RepID=A0A927EEL7_9HYPH|nr:MULTISPECIES: cation transporter [Bosea]MBD3847324.1 cation transporter [Bosea spartocytisi]MCP4559313.1 cation transporter [Bosea sp. (in: a-proteobacteria)]MCP4733914.1 cation transporter [Bosea sp. (in: a-proteobacteria)]MCT4475258.1 cation transporter [Bosea spartocytisi]